MFGESSATLKLPAFNFLPISVNEELLRETMEVGRERESWVLAFVVGTKPCFYKAYGVIRAAEKRKIPFFVINTEQHHETVLTRGLRELGLDRHVYFNLGIRGDLAHKCAELFVKVSYVAKYLRKRFPDVATAPVVIGDTIMTAIVPPAWTFTRGEKALQLEAGLRSMTPKSSFKLRKCPPEEFILRQRDDEMVLLRSEPYPEQYDTFTAAAGSEYLFAPLELNREHLIREGHDPDKTFVIGGLVVDALELKLRESRQSSVFERFPALEEGTWIRIDIHRRGNLTASRFKSILHAIKMLVEKGYQVNFVEMNATKSAIEHHGLRSLVESLTRRPNFLLTPVWPEYSDVVEFYNSDNCLTAITDSGGVQEEFNILQKPLITCRFNTDRPETVQNGGNVLVPPVSSEFLERGVRFVCDGEEILAEMRNAPPLYGSGTGENFATIIERLSSSRAPLFSWAHDQLGLGGGGALFFK
ncbi:MAG: UDP-N-acetyl glucosamine 2-epimerase [Promethearchaeota archaeon]